MPTDDAVEVKEQVFKTPDEIFATKDTGSKTIWIEEWGTNIQVVGLTKQQQLDIRRAAIVDGEADMEKVQLGMFREGVVRPKFDEAQMPLLLQKNAGVIDNILTEVLKLSGMQPGALREKEAGFPSR